ncbi:HIRAN domain-containing protein [uncultured Pseudomonas sp.]|uniref:HIRAN domain-containing protein n=1 Tax=uncultured Pseudomonas sp. TaxID=114707 RepID=UPI002636214C|nr:HIRAN domain-containing protein [uncultured Pseudomonas sp.]
MHILTFLTLISVPFIAGLAYLYWRTDTPKKPSNKSRHETKKKIITVQAEDALESFFCAIAGESFENEDGTSRQDIIRKHAKPGMQVHLQREPENPHDTNAIAAYLGDHQIGYLRSEVAERHAQGIDSGRLALYAEIKSVNGGTKNKPSLGVTLRATLFRVRKQ